MSRWITASEVEKERQYYEKVEMLKKHIKLAKTGLMVMSVSSEVDRVKMYWNGMKTGLRIMEGSTEGL